MNNLIPLLFTLLFLIFWFIGAISWFRVTMTGAKLKRLVHKHDRNIRFIFGFSSVNGLSIPNIIKGSEKFISMFFCFGSPESVRKYLTVFIDLDAIYATHEATITTRMDKITSNVGLGVKAFWGMIVSIVLVWLFLV